MLICMIGYTDKTLFELKRDVVRRTECEKLQVEVEAEALATGKAERWSPNYSPTLTVGHILGRAIICFIPILNFITALFKFSFQFIGTLIEVFGKFFDAPIVRERK